MASVESPPASPHASELSQIHQVDSATFEAVDWEALALIAQNRYNATSSAWDKYYSGGYNVIRFLALNLKDAASTMVVVRVPRKPDEGFSPDSIAHVRDRMTSEIATMQFIEHNTNIPAPLIIEYNVEPDGGGVGLPYIVMTHATGVPLISTWDTMEEESRKEIIRQTISIYLELDKHRFDHVGSLFVEAVVPRRFVVGKPVCSEGADDLPSFTRALDRCTATTSQANFWLSCADERLCDIDEMEFGSESKINDYADIWLIRSYIPSLYQSPTALSILTTPFLDRGFRLFHGDFDSQNVLVDGDRITSLLDWEYSGTAVTGTTAEYPHFMLDRPDLPPVADPDPFAAERERNRHDQALFLQLLREEELARGIPADGQRLSDAFEIPKSVRIVQQLLQAEMDLPSLHELFECMYSPEANGDKEPLDIAMSHCETLKYEGDLRPIKERYEKETEVFQEAQQLLGDLCEGTLGRSEFVSVLKEHSGQLNDILRAWLAEQSHPHC